MTTTYPKQYVLDRIAARRASLEAAQREAEAEAIGIAEEISAALTNWEDEVDTLLHQARSINVLNVDDAKRKLSIAKRASEMRVPGEGPLGRRGEQETPEQALSRRAYDARLAEPAVQRRAAELDAIDHVTAYLQGTPVDEFTLTQLKTLGLLDFVKFDLARAKGEN